MKMLKGLHRETFICIVIIIFSFIVLFSMTIFSEHMEAKTYNKFTNGKKATLIDALFSNLRIEACK